MARGGKPVKDAIVICYVVDGEFRKAVIDDNATLTGNYRLVLQIAAKPVNKFISCLSARLNRH